MTDDSEVREWSVQAGALPVPQLSQPPKRAWPMISPLAVHCLLVPSSANL